VTTGEVAAVSRAVVAELARPRLAGPERVARGQHADGGTVRQRELAGQYPDELRDERVRPAGQGTRAPGGSVTPVTAAENRGVDTCPPR